MTRRASSQQQQRPARKLLEAKSAAVLPLTKLVLVKAVVVDKWGAPVGSAAVSLDTRRVARAALDVGGRGVSMGPALAVVAASRLETRDYPPWLSSSHTYLLPANTHTHTHSPARPPSLPR